MNTTRRKLIGRPLGLGLLAGIFGSRVNLATAAEPIARIPAGTTVADWHAELTRRIAALDARGGGTLGLGDGVYEIDKTLLLPRSVSLVMTPNAVIRAKSGFQGDAVIFKSGGSYSKFSATAGWIRGGVIDGNSQKLTGIKVDDMHRLEIADLSVLNALYRGIDILKGGNENNLTRVRCDVDMKTPIAPGSIGIQVAKTDCKFSNLHVIGYETGIASHAGSNWFNQIHVWNWVPTQGAMKVCFHCNGTNNSYNQCYADSPSVAGFHVTKPSQTVIGCRVYYSQWAADNSGAGFLITPEGRNGTYIGNVFFAKSDHRLAKAYDGNLGGACILGSSSWNVVGGFENQIPSGRSSDQPPLNLAGTGIRLTRQLTDPTNDQGDPGEVRWVDDGKASALWIKTTRGWKKSELL
jgi:hypothetical protein